MLRRVGDRFGELPRAGAAMLESVGDVRRPGTAFECERADPFELLLGVSRERVHGNDRVEPNARAIPR